MFEEFLWPKFKPATKYMHNEHCSCGGTALSIIMNVCPCKIHSKHPDNENWGIGWMCNFLARHGYKYVEIKKDMLRYLSRYNRSPIIRPTHVVLGIMSIDNEESTWFVSYRGKIYHVNNMFGYVPVTTLLLNNPIEKLFLVKKMTKNES